VRFAQVTISPTGKTPIGKARGIRFWLAFGAAKLQNGTTGMQSENRDVMNIWPLKCVSDKPGIYRDSRAHVRPTCKAQ